jgi:hypothetical protein
MKELWNTKYNGCGALRHCVMNVQWIGCDNRRQDRSFACEIFSFQLSKCKTLQWLMFVMWVSVRNNLFVVLAKIVLKESNHWKVLLSELNIFILSQAYCWACKLIVGLAPWVYTAIVSEIYYSWETYCQGVLIANLHMHHMLYYLYLVFPPFFLGLTIPTYLPIYLEQSIFTNLVPPPHHF